MTLTILHKHIKFAKKYVYRYFGLKIPGGYGDIYVYHTQF